MCLAPVVIKNPYCGCDPSKGYNYLHDCVSTHIAVPCGHCKDCITTRQSAFAVRCDIEGMNYVSVPFMLTLTYDDAHVPRMPEVGDVLDNFAFPDWSHVRNMMKRLRHVLERRTDKALADLFVLPKKVNVRGRDRLIPAFKYVFVSEFGKISARPHFHALIYVKSPYLVTDSKFESWACNLEKKLGDWFKENWAINIGSIQKPVYEKLYTYVARGNRRTFDFHRIVHSDDVSDDSPMYYVSKYLFKCNDYIEKFRKFVWRNWQDGKVDDKRYYDFLLYITRNLRVSKYFGYPFEEYQLKRIHYSFDFARRQKMPFPCYIGTDGKQQVFPHYLKHLITPEYATIFAFNITHNNDLINYVNKSIMDASDFDSKEAQLKTLARVIRSTDDCLSDFPRYELRYDQGCGKACSRRFDNDNFRIYQQSNQRGGHAEFEDVFRQFEDLAPRTSEEVEELYLFGNPLNFEIL